MNWRAWLVILSAICQIACSVDESSTEHYKLPPSKVYIESCQQQALQLHPGFIERQQFFHQRNNFWVQHEIRIAEGSEWIVLCDLRRGQVVGQQKLLDSMP